MLGAFAEFERLLVRARTRMGTTARTRRCLSLVSDALRPYFLLYRLRDSENKEAAPT
jgi:hypothetical protein